MTGSIPPTSIKRRRTLSLFVLLAVFVPVLPLRGAEKKALSLEADPLIFSPNGDGRKDAVYFLFGTQGLENIHKWRIVLYDALGRRVWRDGGRGTPPGLLEWAGVTLAHKTAREGVYVAQARVWASRNKAASPAVDLVVDLTPPLATVELSTPIFSPGPEQAVGFLLRAEDSIGLSHWELRIFSDDTPTLSIFSSTGGFENGAASPSWDGRTQQTQSFADNGSYRTEFIVEDAAGNQQTLSSPLQISVDSTTALASAASAMKITPLPDGGFKVIAPSDSLFDPANSSSLKAAGPDSALNQLFSLAKSHPTHRLLLNGYAGSEKTSTRRVDLSSAQVWAIYSALVKGGVSATRLEVHGLGGKFRDVNRIEILFTAPPAPPPDPLPDAPAP
ncbi:MAG TPA: hypothetical protein P5079_04595 [Elusimicrobiota bacterium]|nr:hypothetical protein [Elusimicrobiota bacterium]